MTPIEEPIDIRSVQDRVYARIREAMRKGVFAPGQPLTIRALAARFGTSEMPVREAIKRLVAEKALVQQADRTFQVPEVNAEGFDDLLLVRVLIEGRATELTAGRVDAALLAKLEGRNRAMATAVAQGDLAGTLEHNQEFHFLIYEACGNTTLIELIEMLWLRSGPYLAALAAGSEGIDAFSEAVHSHERIMDGLRTANGPEAAAALQLDIETTARWFWSRRSRDGDKAPSPTAGAPAAATPPGKRRRQPAAKRTPKSE